MRQSIASNDSLDCSRAGPTQKWLAILALMLLLALAACHRQKDVPYVVTPPATVDAILELGEVTGKDVVYDLGSGDGRIVIAAAKKFGARGVGIEIDPELVKLAVANTRNQGVDHLVDIEQGDVITADISAATVVTLYLNSAINLMLKPKLWNQLRPGARVVSHYFPIKGWQPDVIKVVQDPAGNEVNLYLWRITRDHARQIAN